MFSAPTAVRVLKKQDPAFLKKYDLSSLKALFLAGEPLDEMLERRLFKPLGMISTGYLPQVRLVMHLDVDDAGHVAQQEVAQQHADLVAGLRDQPYLRHTDALVYTRGVPLGRGPIEPARYRH